MATVTTEVDSTAYVEVSTVDALVQNTSRYGMYVVFDTSLPTVDTPNRHLLDAGQAITKSSGVPAGNIYVRCAEAGRSVFVSVSS